jgi:hypothetical protein
MKSHDCSDASGIVPTFSVVSASFSVINDFYILVLPLPIIARLRLSLKKKLPLVLLFMTGLG